MSENDFECFASTGVNTPGTMFPNSTNFDFPEALEAADLSGLTLCVVTPLRARTAIIPNEDQVWRRRVWRGVRDTGCLERE